ncbi:DMT family transporter [Synergistes jonesii]|uniref:EamA domain-containing protein n=1 Tax=Synergistes jonesii TaxID=2754 RepID=A0A073IQN5_9BACT|nr:DMT family transporter [Synergistes jonesii]KEJ92029.1 hypothetical protein EH55_06505 [Synergistes jonesii]OFB61973.1 hypothetical protein JS73_08605 [Synergistes jonesii]OFB62578.1 hypothetical protein JS79_09070 [Synergistes jonesii]OFB64267.1 hypothetical protein JS72_04885 [Synergistes jonesii]OFB67414.1 hypothetical protein JS78_08615 [Synergistes jonesii]
MKNLILLLPVICGIMWGSNGIFVRELSAFGVDRIGVLAARFVGAAAVVFLVILAYDRKLFKIKRAGDLFYFVGSGLVGMLALNFCYNEAINRLTLSLAAVLLNLNPVFVVALAAILFHEKITVRKVVCMALAILGCVFVSGIFEETAGIKWSAAGILIGLVAAFFYALYNIFSKFATEKGYHTFTIIFYSFLLISIVLAPLTNWGQIKDYAAAAPARHCLFLLLFSLCTSVLPYILFTFALKHGESGKCSILAAGGEPIAASVFGMLIFHELPTFFMLLGLAVTIVALAFLCMSQKENL